MFWAGRGFGRGVWAERISPVEFLILLMLKREPTHGYDMIQILADEFSGVWSPKPGTVYPAIARLEEKNLIKLKEGQGEGTGGKGEGEYPPKKVYVLTERGVDSLKNIIGKMDFEEKFIDRFMGVVDQSVWFSFDNMALKRIEGSVERAIAGASDVVRGALRVLSPQDSIHELEFYRNQLQTELDAVDKKVAELKDKEKRYRKVKVE